jgi:hypothetical protein
MAPLPFSVEQFFKVFADYNQSVWPFQWALSGVAVAALLLLVSEHRNKDRLIGAVLALLWAWAALAYHVWHFSRINPAACFFAVLFLVEAALLLWFSSHAQSLRFNFRPEWRKWLGVGLILYALAIYPAIGRLAGHNYPATSTFGVPCPTTIFTLGMLCMAEGRRSLHVAVIPLLWTAIGGSAAFLLGVPQDLGLVLAGVALVATIPRRTPRAH